MVTSAPVRPRVRVMIAMSPTLSEENPSAGHQRATGRHSLLLRLRRQELPERRKQCVNVSLVFPPVYNLNPIACALDIDSAGSAGCDCDLLTPRAHTHFGPGLNPPGFRIRSADAKPALRYCFHAGLKDFIHSCGKVLAVLIACAHFSSIHAHSGLTVRSARNMISDRPVPLRERRRGQEHKRGLNFPIVIETWVPRRA